MSDGADLPRTRVRLEDVARRAGISKSIASRILNGFPGVSVRPETRERVLAVAKELNYHPHAAARGLKRAETGAIGLLVPPLTNPVYVRIIRGAFQRARERDFVVLLIEDVDAQQTEETFVKLVQTGRIDGLIVASARPRHPLLRSLRSFGLPHVFVNRAVIGAERSVTMDDARASAAALDHLVALGHQRIGHVAGPRHIDPADRRASGFREYAAQLGLQHAFIAEGDFSETGGTAAARSLLEREPRPTALYTSSLSQAVGALHAAWQMGLSVPRDLSVITYDDMPLADFLQPPVTTIKMPLAELGAAAVDALTSQLLGADPHDVTVPTTPEVVVRLSTAPPNDVNP